jgi:hypothetical protein
MSEWVIVVKRQMGNVSWREQVLFDDMMMCSLPTRPTNASVYRDNPQKQQ